jgi:predicted RNase H-like HicB family nuclease
MTTRHYLGIAEHLPENWSISFPAFPGTVTTGRDFAELMTNARDALASVVAAMDEGLVARLDSLADRAHASRSALLARGARMVLAAEAEEPNLAEAIRRRFAPLGGVELETLPPLLPGRRLG